MGFLDKAGACQELVVAPNTIYIWNYLMYVGRWRPTNAAYLLTAYVWS